MKDELYRLNPKSVADVSVDALSDAQLIALAEGTLDNVAGGAGSAIDPSGKPAV